MSKTDITKKKSSSKLKTLKQNVAEPKVLKNRQPASIKPVHVDDDGIYKAIFESADESIILIDKKGIIIDFNNRLSDIGGYQREDILGKNIRSLSKMITRKGLVIVVKNLLKRLAGAQVAPYEIELVKKNGELIPVEISARPLKKDGKIIGDLVIIRNITQRKQVEEALRESEEKYRLIVNNTRDIIFTLNPEGQFLYISPSIEKVLGYNQTDLIGKTFRAVVHPDDVDVVNESIRHLVEDGVNTPGGIDFRAHNSSGEWRWQNASGNVAYDEKGKLINFIGVVRDITERKQVEEALKDSETKYRNVVEIARDGICIIQDRIIEYCNPQLAKIWGGTVEEIKGTPFTSYLHPDAVPLVVERYNRRTAGEPVSSEYETVLRNKNGEDVFVELSVGNLEYLGKDAEIVIVHDISERKKTEKALKTSEYNFRNFLDNSTIGIRIRDADGRVSYSNQAFLDIFGYKNAVESEVHPPHEYYSPESYAEFLLRKDKIERGEQVPNTVEVDIVRKDGTIRHVQIFGHRQLWDNKYQAQTYFSDVTELKQTQEALRVSEQNFRNSLDSSLIGINIVDADNNSLYLNRTFLSIFGYENPEEVKMKPPYKHYTPESYAIYRQRTESILRGEPIPDKLEVDIIRKDGSLRHLELFRKEVFWDGKPQFQILYNDITERVQAEEALKLSEQNLRNSMDSSLTGIRIVDTAWHTLYANQVFMDIFGYKNIDDIGIASPQELYTPEEYARYLEREARRQQGIPVPEILELDIVRTDGTIRHVLTSRKEVLWNGKMEYQLLCNDITERRQTEEALRLSEEKYRLIVENTHDMFFTLDEAGCYIYMSPSVTNLLGYNPAELIGTPFISLVHPEDKHIIQRVIQLLREQMRGNIAAGNQDSEELEYRVRHASGEWRWVVSKGKRVANVKGQFLNFSGVIRDVTESKLADDALKLSEQNFRNSMDNSSIGIRISNINETLYANQAMLDIFGYRSVDELQTIQPQEFYSPEAHAGWVLRHGKLLNGEPMPKQIAIDIIRKDGTVRNLQVSMMDVFWNGKQYHQTLYNDVTEFKRAEEALKASEQNFRNLMDNSVMGIRIVDVDDRILYVNQTFMEIFGYSNIDEVRISPPQAHYTPESYAAYLLRGEKLRRGEDVPENYEIDVLHKNGTLRHLQLFRKEVFWNGKQQWQILYNDITERTQAEEVLKTSEQNLHNSLDDLPMGIRITDIDDNTLYLNQAFLNIFGYENSDEVTRRPPLQDFYTPESYTVYLRRKDALLRGEPRPDRVEVDIIRKDGQLRHLQLTTGELLWNGQKQYQTLYNDVTERKQTEEALKESEQNFRNSLDSSSLGINIIDERFRTLYANQALLDIFGYKNIDEVRVTRPYKFYTPESYAKFVERNQRVLRGEPAPDKVEVDIIRRDGTLRHLQVFRKEVLWDGKIHVQTLYSDVTEQKKIETALRESEEKYRTIFESANDIIILLDTTGKILDVNERLTEIGGYDRSELIARNIMELTHIISEKSMAVVVANLGKILQDTGVVSYQIEMIKKNMEPIYLEINGTPVKKDGKVVGAQAVLRDITGRSKSERLIKEQKALTDRILESTPNAVAVVGQDKRIIMINKAFEHTFNIVKEEAEDKEIRKIIPVPLFIDTVSQVLISEKSQFQVEFRLKNGVQESVMVADIISTQKNEVLVMLHDITEEREIQERLYLTDRLASLGEMAAGIAHELNNPLTGVVALSQLLLESGVPEGIKEDLESISSEGQRAASVVKNLLSFARSHTVSAQPVDINAVVDQVLNLRAYEHRVNNIEVVTHLAPNLPEIVADRFQLQQVFLNVVLNAEQAMIESHNRGNLTVTTEQLDNIIKISFNDDGPGIPFDIINRIFDPFFTTKEVGKGTGLGLSICYGIVTKQGGRIYAESQPGKGATFIVELPIAVN